MVGSILKFGALLVAGILVYNYFFGTDSEKENSRKLFGEMRDVVVSAGQLLKSERQKFDAGKYDKALDQLGGAYKVIRDQASKVDGKVLARLTELEQRKAALESEIDAIEAAENEAAQPAPPPKKGLKKDTKAEQTTAAKAADQARKKAELLKSLEDLVRDSDVLLQEAQQ